MTARARRVTRALLARMPLPAVDDDGDKDDRGRVLVIAGSATVPGAALLAAVAALRAGAGKLQIATVSPAAITLGIAVPESLVIALPTTRRGEIAGARAAHMLEPRLDGVDSVVVGPGMSDRRATHAFLAALVPHLDTRTTLVLDASAIEALAGDERLLEPLRGRAVLTPHSGEMATLFGVDRAQIDASPRLWAERAAAQVGAVVALKGGESWIADPDETMYRFDGGSVGLATSGSGDTLAGIIAGLAARGADPRTAALWGVWAHGLAGRRLAKRMGAIGFLARELLAEIPSLVGR